MESQSERIHDYNTSYVEGKAQENRIEEVLQKQGYIVKTCKGNNKYYDMILISPFTNTEYILQIKSSKEKIPYITCNTETGLIEQAQIMKCKPLLCLMFTTKKQFVILDVLTKKVLFSNLSKDSKAADHFQINQVAKFKCFNKEK